MTTEMDEYEDGIEHDNEDGQIESYNPWQNGSQLVLAIAILFTITAILFWVAIQP